jgi:hypothetical protein
MQNISERCEDCERLGYVCNGSMRTKEFVNLVWILLTLRIADILRIKTIHI